MCFRKAELHIKYEPAREELGVIEAISSLTLDDPFLVDDTLLASQTGRLSVSAAAGSARPGVGQCGETCGQHGSIDDGVRVLVHQDDRDGIQRLWNGMELRSLEYCQWQELLFT